MTTQRKVYVGVLGLALAALVLDRALLGGGGSPQSAAASSALSDSVAPSTTNAVVVPASVVEAAGNVEFNTAWRQLSIRVNALAVADVTHDAFRPGDSWISEAETAPAALPAEQFAQTHRLDAVMMADDVLGQGYALVDGAPIQVGGILEGFELIEVGSNWARFEASGYVVELRVPAAR